MSGNNKIDMPTNEGTLALARAVATGIKLVIRGAVPCFVNGAISSASEVARTTWGEPDPEKEQIDLSEYAITQEIPTGGELPVLIESTSYLPSSVDPQGTYTGVPISALDIEFTWMPSEKTVYDTIAVLADVYYEFVPFTKGSNYPTGATVSVALANGTYEYYMCTESVTDSEMPASDSEHWSQVTPNEPTDKIIVPKGGVSYRSIGDRPVLLYVSITKNSITVSNEIEVDYKVRLYIDVPEATTISNHIVFDTLGPEFMSSAQLELLANYASQFASLREVACARANRG